ncbi:MAG: transcriptional regulator [Alishewanella sp. 34-51-39]|uniref:helix-turn-helix domain-containing protein n=1 Tax=Alishewanella sp. BS5-314 TaxID=2755587 RepID=UPI000BC6CB62|nr:helix-turn-helix transcriptional regulator [Alishewanella sp. BS5-314]MCT8126510.1 helix-turn-helix transcriptional regulator [Alishewanella sp. BS5-314]OZB43052.1 MAG: transcriptional regulator [Alishewanella sp. 34-51-39]
MDISAEKLKQLRLDRGLSQDLLAKQSGLSLRTIQRLEQAGGGSPESLLALSAALNISPQALRTKELPPASAWSFQHQGVKISALLLLVALLLFLVSLASSGQFSIYLDLVSLVFLILFVPTVTLLAAGKQNLKLSVRHLGALFTEPSGNQAERTRLLAVYRLQYQLCYSGALVITLLGLISLLHFSAEFDQSLLQSGISVLSLPWLYAAVVSEILLRPIIFKIQLSLKDES